ncbi:DUF4132 domain-containing protein [Hymenobacter sp. BT559]|uniref:DUF4132 domain-containing protein n=1 Tax=Hymenobacter sp. BT559 TaxID=2795729 RepID=UPI0018EB510A|nr:DUF4132 domain-containing protein [Hymenobacter sp. BT559]MBJ6142721.1 DUF4132 domain-containing protein [Hymenobacter sp. BT559]
MAAPTKDPLLHLFDDPSPEAVEMKPVLQELATEALAKTYNEKVTSLPAYRALLKQSAAYKSRFVLALATAMHECVQRQDYSTRYALGEVLTSLMRGPHTLGETDYLRLFRLYGLDFSVVDHQARRTAVWGYPLGLTLGQVAKLARQQPPGEAMQAFLQQLLDYAVVTPGDIAKLIPKVQEIMLLEAGPGALPTLRFGDGDPFGDHLNQFAAGLDKAAASTGPWLRLLLQWQKVSGGQPTAKLRKELDAGATAVGAAAVRQQASEWLALLLAMPVVEQAHVHDYGNGATYTYRTYDYLQEGNATVAKGLIWTLQPLADAPLLQQLADLAAKCYRKVPGKGPLAAGLGNACLLVLSQNGLPGVSALARVRSKIKQTNTQELIAKHIQQASQTLGVSPAEIEDMAVPDFGLINGQVEEALGDYTATLLLASGKADVQWAKAGKPLKTAPTALKATHADDLKELKLAQTQAQQTYTTQRDRLDRSFIDERRIAWPWFEQYYFRHGLVSLLAHALIWRLHRPDGTFQDALWLAGQWQGAHGQPVPAPTADTELQLWHPVLAPAAEVLAWRELLERYQLRQPLKQAYREVYLLTPPEERTRTYSNRMAAHILKQHQFNFLAKLRGWKYSLLGAYDKGYESDKATLALPAQQLQAEFWVSEVNADDAWNDTGIYLYISTDQVRFVRGDEVVPLPEVPALTFSEVMRDVDLFVGVASVGNDPLWRDNGGLVQYRDYWQHYSFGELGEVAKNRKLALERLVPRLKIGKVSELSDRFLVVRGKLRTYKIHLGSGNILMEPNDQYLCIVPDRSAKSATATDVFLPFEGDAVLSIILSKALLLMDDDKITDETIVRQIKYKK